MADGHRVTGHRESSPPPLTAPCERLVSTHARRPPMTPPDNPVWPLDAVLPPDLPCSPSRGGSRWPSFSRTRLPYLSPHPRHELHRSPSGHRHVATFLHVNRPLAGSALVRSGYVHVKVCLCVISNTQGTHGGTHGHTDTRDTDHTDNVCTNTVNVCTHATASQETGRHRYGATKSWWYLCRACHSGQLIEHHQWEHSWSWRRCVRSCLSMLSCLH